MQGLDILESSGNGSVSTGTRRLAWGELDFVAPGVTADSAFVFARRYFSGLSHDGTGSTGARWVSSVTEALIPQTVGALRALQHFSWAQPYNDPDYYYVEQSPGSNVFTSSAAVGGAIVQTGNSYELTFKNGAKHTFVESPHGVRIVERCDPWSNSTSFVYEDPPSGGGGGFLPLPDPNAPLNGGMILITDSRGVTYTLTLDVLGYITSVTDSLGAVTDLDYTTVGSTNYLTKVRYPSRQVMEPNGSIVTRRPEREYTYDSNGRLYQVIDDYGTVILANTYDTVDPSKIATQTDGTGAVYTFTEPAVGQTDVLTPNGWKRSYLHNTEKQVVELRQYIANFSGNPARSTNPSLHHTWLFERAHGCNCGVVTKITEPDGGTMHLVYSADLDLLEVRKVSPDQVSVLKWKWTYDSEHRIATFVPPEGNAPGVDPVPHTVTTTRTPSGTDLITTRTIPPRDWRSTASVWEDISDSRGRMKERKGPPHGSGNTSFLGKWTYHTQGTGLHLPLQVYQRDVNTVACSYQWNAAGRLTSITDDASRQWSATYDPEGRPLTWTAPTINGNQSYTHEWLYDGNGRLRRLRWKYFADDTVATGPWIEWFYTYDAMGQVLTCTKQLDNATPTPTFATETWTYDQHGNVLTAADPDGHTTSATYDERDLPWVMTDGVGTTEQTSKSYDYNPDGRLTVIVERLDATRQVRFENEYDGLDRLMRYRIKDAATPSVQAGYVETSYEAGSRIQEIRTYATTSGGTPQLVDKKAFVYDDYHDCPTRQTSYAYDLATGNQLRAVQSDFDYGPSGRPMREYTAGTLIAEYTYLDCGLPQRIQDAHGNKLELTWDQYGRVLTETNVYDDPVGGTPLTTVRTFTRDAFGRATTITDSGAGVTSQSHTYVYDSADNVVEHTGPDGAVQLYQFRFDGAMTRQDAVIAGSTVRARQVQFTPGGREYIVTDDRNNNVSFVYDGRGRLKQEVYPDGTTWTNAFNDAGLLTKITAPTGRTVDFTYDWRGMIAGTVYKDSAGVVKRTDVFEIDLGGFIKRVTKTENGVTQYVDMANDSTGRVLTETTVIPGLPTWAVTYQYDARGRMSGITSPHGYQHLYQYDDRNRVASIELVHGSEGTFSVADYMYLGSGRSVVQRETGDGNKLTVTRDGHGRLTGMETPGVAEFQYGYDAGNRVNYEMRALDGKGDAYWYDGLGRLTKTTKDSTDPVAELASGGTGSTVHAFRRQFMLDGDSHRAQVVKTPMGSAAETTNYTTHSTRHHYTQIQTVGQPAVSRAFDLDGRLTGHGARSFHYDAADNLIEVQDAGSTIATYGFDALGRRVTKAADGFEYRFVHAGPWMIEDYRRLAGSGSAWFLKGGYVHGPGIDNIVMMRHRDWVDQDIDTDKIEPKNLFYHTNRIGSVTELTAEDGSVVERYRYEEYGKPTVLDANGVVLPAAVAGNSFLFTGREYDWETGLYHYRARAYDPSTGSFLQEDPLGMRDGINVVAYVHANPVNLSDPFGTDGVGEMVENIMNFINENRGLVAGLIMDLLSPLEGILDLMSAVTGKDITGWIRGGMKDGGPASMGWWDRACAAASAAVSIAAGALKLIGKLKDVLKGIENIVDQARAAGAARAKEVLCKLTGQCFVAGTLVAMADGSFVPIEDVVAEQSVHCESPAAMPGARGSAQVGVVTDASSRPYEGAIITLVVEGSGKSAKISGTPEHPFWCVNRHQWVPMGQLAAGDSLDGKESDVTVVGRDVAFGRLPVFNLTVAGAHSYRVSELGLLVHNNDGCLRNLTKHELKNIDAHALKAGFVGKENMSKFNIAKDGDDMVVLTPVRRGTAPNVHTNISVSEAAETYPSR